MIIADQCYAVSTLPPQEWSLDMVEWRRGWTIFGPRRTQFAPFLADLSLVDALIWLDMTDSKGAARQAIASNSVRINGQRVNDVKRMLAATDILPQGFIAFQIGKSERNVLFVEEMT